MWTCCWRCNKTHSFVSIIMISRQSSKKHQQCQRRKSQSNFVFPASKSNQCWKTTSRERERETECCCNWLKRIYLYMKSGRRLVKGVEVNNKWERNEAKTKRFICCTKSMQINSQQRGGRNRYTRGRGCLGTVLMCLWLLRNWQSIRATNNVGNYALADD